MRRFAITNADCPPDQAGHSRRREGNNFRKRRSPAIRLTSVFNLSGQVIGLSVGYGSGGGYVVPIDSALQVAKKIAGR